MKTKAIALFRDGFKQVADVEEKSLNHNDIQATIDVYDLKLLLIINEDIDKTVEGGTKPALKLVS